MLSPARSLAAVQICVCLVLLLPLSACLGAETASLNRTGTVDSSTAGATLPSPPTRPVEPPTQAAFMTEGSATVVGYDVFGPEGLLVYRTTFTPRPGADFGSSATDTVWLGRRETFGPTGQRDVTTTSSLECPGIIIVLERVAALDTGRFNVSGISRRPLGLGPQSRDGHTYRFFGPGYGPDDAHTRLSVEATTGAARDLGNVAETELSACWRSE